MTKFTLVEILEILENYWVEPPSLRTPAQVVTPKGFDVVVVGDLPEDYTLDDAVQIALTHNQGETHASD